MIFVLLTLFAVAPIASHLLGHGPNTALARGANINRTPVPPWTHVPLTELPIGPIEPGTGHTLFILGGDGSLGRDEFLRLLYGGQVSLEIALGATLIAVGLGLLLGTFAGYFGGWTDAAVSRVTEFTMGFPVLLLLIVLGTTISDRFAANIVLEASISFLGLGIRLPTASWGNMLSTNWGTLLQLGPGQAVFIKGWTSTWTTVLPVVAVGSTVLAVAAFGEGLRRALDPRSAQ